MSCCQLARCYNRGYDRCVSNAAISYPSNEHMQMQQPLRHELPPQPPPCRHRMPPPRRPLTPHAKGVLSSSRHTNLEHQVFAISGDPSMTTSGKANLIGH